MTSPSRWASIWPKAAQTASLLIILFCAAPIFWGLIASHPPAGDFLIDLNGARRLMHGTALYGHVFTPDTPDPYLYPPFLATALLPLAPVSDASASAIWRGILAVVWLIGAGVLLRRFSWRERFPLFVGALFFSPTIFAWYAGNIDFLVVSFIAIALGISDGAGSGALLAIATALKVHPAYLLWSALWRGNFRLLFGAAIAGSALLLATVLCIGTSPFLDWTMLTVPKLNQVFPDPNAQSIGSALARFFVTPPPPGASLARFPLPAASVQHVLQTVNLVAALAGAAIIGLYSRTVTRNPDREPFLHAGTLALMVCVPSISWYSRYALIPVALALLWPRATRPGKIAAFLCYVGIQIFPITVGLGLIRNPFIAGLPVLSALALAGIAFGAPRRCFSRPSTVDDERKQVAFSARTPGS